MCVPRIVSRQLIILLTPAPLTNKSWSTGVAARMEVDRLSFFPDWMISEIRNSLQNGRDIGCATPAFLYPICNVSKNRREHRFRCLLRKCVPKHTAQLYTRRPLSDFYCDFCFVDNFEEKCLYFGLFWGSKLRGHNTPPGRASQLS